MKTIFTCFALLAWVAASATDYYVRTDGNDGNAGTANNAGAAFRTINKACAVAQPGDVVNIADGTYVEGEIVIYNKAGSKTNTLTIRAINRHKAVIKSITGFSVISASSSSGIVIDGLEVTFQNPASSYSFGILADACNWVTVKNCFVHDIGSSGIQINNGEYFVIENNIVRDNGKNTGTPNGSGISVYHPKYSPNYVAGEWGIIIRNNICFENTCPFPLQGFDTPTDGNGIILDDFRNTQGGGQPGGYMHPSLVENNLVFDNGGRGVHVYQSDNVTIRNNTLYHNNFELSKYYGFGWNGDLNLDQSDGAKIYNNIIVMDNANVRGYAMLVPMDADVRSNLIVGAAARMGSSPVEGTLPADNQIQPLGNQGYVKFSNATTAVDPFDTSNPQFSRFFGLAPGSPAINAGNSTNAASTDLENKNRPIGGITDIGCYEAGAGGAPPAGDTQAPTVPANLSASGQTAGAITLSWTASTDNVGVAGYDVFRGGVAAGSSTAATYTATGLAPATAYSFTVRARDAAGNASAQSAPLAASTLPAATPPAAAGTGLKGEFFTQFGYGLAAARAAIAVAVPLHTFTATAVDYPANAPAGTGGWNTWLGADGAGAPARPVQPSTLRLGGYIQVRPEFDVQAGNATIEVDFAVGSQGYAALRVNNAQVLSNEANWAFGTQAARVSFPSAGYYPVELLHATSYDASGLEFYSSIAAPGNASTQTPTIVPKSVLFPQLPGARLSAEKASVLPVVTSGLVLYPNPANTQQAVSVFSPDFPDGKAEIKVMDMAGKTVFAQKGNFRDNSIQLTLKTLSPGMYTVFVSDGRRSKYGKFVVR